MYPKWLISLTKMGKKSKNNRVTKLGSIILIISVIITLILLFSCSVMSIAFVTPETVARRAPPSTGYPRQQYRNGWPFPSFGASFWLRSKLQADSSPLSHRGSPHAMGQRSPCVATTEPLRYNQRAHSKDSTCNKDLMQPKINIRGKNSFGPSPEQGICCVSSSGP